MCAQVYNVPVRRQIGDHGVVGVFFVAVVVVGLCYRQPITHGKHTRYLTHSHFAHRAPIESV